MSTRTGLVAWAACAALCALSVDASAQLPDDRSTQVNIRVDPADPNSSVLYEIKLFLTAIEADGDSVGWDIAKTTIRKLDSSGAPVTKWTDSAVTISTNDGLWWIDHSDAAAPLNAEFIEPPVISGTGQQGNSNNPYLDYQLQGFAYTAPPGGAPFEITGSLDLRPRGGRGRTGPRR